MGNLMALLSKNCNYIYHMLSVSNCGYDNEYGRKYRVYHDEKDLQILKKWEKHITVAGGEHCGELYGICVSIPASFDNETVLPAYFEALINMFEYGKLEQNFEEYQSIYKLAFSSFGITINMKSQREFYNSAVHLKKVIIDISKIMLNNYNIYNDKIWDISKRELSNVIDELNIYLEKVNYVSKWEKLLSCKYKHDNFIAVICNSIQNGSQCIDISYNKDVFYLPDTYSTAVKLISHEFGIYLLMDVLSDTLAFKQRECYKIVESLAEYFNIIISGGHTEWDWYKEYLDFYKELKKENPQITAKDMFLQAVDFFNITSD